MQRGLATEDRFMIVLTAATIAAALSIPNPSAPAHNSPCDVRVTPDVLQDRPALPDAVRQTTASHFGDWPARPSARRPVIGEARR